MVSRERRDERDVEMQSQRKNQNVATQDLERKPNSDCSMRILWPNIFHLQVSSQNIGHWLEFRPINSPFASFIVEQLYKMKLAPSMAISFLI